MSREKKVVLMFETVEERARFEAAIKIATGGRAVMKRDKGWTKPALETDLKPSQILAASLWAGFQPKAILD
jgi:hypothetical protein